MIYFRTNFTIIRFVVRHTRTLAKQTVPVLVTRRESKFLPLSEYLIVLTPKAQETTDDLPEMNVSQKAQKTNIC